MAVTITLRLDENVVAILRAESGTHHISLNAMVNQTLQNFVEWNMYEPKVGMMSLFRIVVAEIFKRLTDQQITEIAATVGKEAYTDAILFMKKKIDLDSFLSWLETRMKNSSVEVSHCSGASIHTYVLKHDLGRNFSLFQKALLESILGEILGIHIDCDFTDKIVSFRFSTA